MNTFAGYIKNSDGTLSICDVERIDDEFWCGNCPLEQTKETATLRGWPDEGISEVWITGGGIEVLIPIARIERRCWHCGKRSTEGTRHSNGDFTCSSCSETKTDTTKNETDSFVADVMKAIK